jgi:phosphatidylserine decarboxylase
MKLHKEGYKILLTLFLVLVVINGLIYWLSGGNTVVMATSILLSFLLFLLFAQFFRVPARTLNAGDHDVVCPADGKVVVIEEVFEDEFLKKKVIQISVFMSPLNVHVNSNPISGRVTYFKYHKGLYLVAWHPKSSTENERTTVVVEDDKGRSILFRQIAGAVARRICWYINKGNMVEQGEEFGFIKFGSRVDVFVPLNSEIKVKIGDKVKGVETILATLS